ncbi:MAG: APC family permease [Deltaproteobacteria bacterium]|nr:APC family permease [Deltaproteobacteria bacterium]
MTLATAPDPAPSPPPAPGSPPAAAPEPRLGLRRLRRALFGAPRDLASPATYRHVSLVALLAWVGLGADGLSSSAYGPEEAFRAIGAHHYLAVALALATAGTVLVISLAYASIIQHFPFGGGGYVVATRLLGPAPGVVSGAALLVDYVLTISVSIAAGGDAVWSFLPPGWAAWKLPAEIAVIALLVLLNLRGVRESVATLAPIFALFLLTHLVLLVGAVGSHLGDVPRLAAEVRSEALAAVRSQGGAAVFGLFLFAYSMGAGTYTGIEAVSNGLAIMREPKVATARRTMAYMAVSLALTAGGILVAYLLFRVVPAEGKTMNAVLLEAFAGSWTAGGIPVGRGFVMVSLAAEAALLFVAAQAGFLDGPRVMANMASDSWLPHRFAQLSERLVVRDGVLLMGAASLLTLVVTRGDVTHLVTMYSINVFLTFSLSQAGMVRFFWRRRTGGRGRGLWLHGVAFTLCAGILTGIVYEKFGTGGWITLLVTWVVVGVCWLVRRHYRDVQAGLRRLDTVLTAVAQSTPAPPRELVPSAPTAVLLVGSYAGLGVHSLLSLHRTFPGTFKNVIFVSVGVVDAAAMRGIEEVERVRERTEESLRRYAELARRLGFASGWRAGVATEALGEAEKLCLALAREYPRTVVFAGKLVFREERWFQRLLHNETAYALQRRLQFAGLHAMVLPVRVLEQG